MSKHEETSQIHKCEQFATLHQQEGAFLIPNPWDAGSARLLQGLGFQAIATTSAGVAHTLAKADGEISLEEKIEHCASLANITSIPVNADFENGFADDPQTVAINVLKAVKTGIAGCSVEDFSRESQSLYDFPHAVERIQAAAEALESLDMPFQLTARAENFLRGVDDLEDTIKRLQAFSAAGANVLYAPGLQTLDQLQQVTSEIDKPFNVLAPFFRGVTVDELAAAGAKRISVGNALNLVTLNPLLSAGKEMLEHGTFNWTADMASGKEIDQLLA